MKISGRWRRGAGSTSANPSLAKEEGSVGFLSPVIKWFHSIASFVSALVFTANATLRGVSHQCAIRMWAIWALVSILQYSNILLINLLFFFEPSVPPVANLNVALGSNYTFCNGCTVSTIRVVVVVVVVVRGTCYFAVADAKSGSFGCVAGIAHRILISS